MLRAKAKTVLIYLRWGWHSIIRSLRRARLRRLLRSRAPLVLRFHAPGTGLFAHLSWCLQVASWAGRHNRAFHLSCTSPNYGSPDGQTDWLAQTLVHRQPLPENDRTHAVLLHAFEELPFFTEPAASSIAEAHELFHRHFALPAPIIQRVAELKEQLFGNHFVVGLHYRGTDKQLEASRIEQDDALASARAALATAAKLTDTPPVLFLATDETSLVAQATDALAPFAVCTAGNFLRSDSGTAIHQSSHSFGLRLAEEALIDALLLAECDVLIKTASMLSAWSLVFSGPKPTILLSQPYANRQFFPDHLVSAIAETPGGEARAVAAALSKH